MLDIHKIRSKKEAYMKGYVIFNKENKYLKIDENNNITFEDDKEKASIMRLSICRRLMKQLNHKDDSLDTISIKQLYKQ